MKKIMSLMLGLTLLTGAVTIASAQEGRRQEEGQEEEGRDQAHQLSLLFSTSSRFYRATAACKSSLAR